MAFAHLHVHTEYSLLDGSNKIKEYVARVKELGMNSAAITDHGVMYGVIDFYRAARAAGIKPILGCEVYVAPNSRFDKEVNGGEERYHHLVLLAENNTGYANLMKIVSKGFTEGYYYKPRVDMEVLRQYHEGIIALSACLAGEVPRYIMKGLKDEARKCVKKYEDCFGKGNYFLELQDHGIPEQRMVNMELMSISREMDIPLVATNDVHYTYAEDVEPHDILLCLQTGKLLKDENRMRYEGGQYYVKSEEEMKGLFPYAWEAVENTQVIADRCNVEIEFGVTKLPKYEVPEGYDSWTYLNKLCNDGLIARYPFSPEAEKTLRALKPGAPLLLLAGVRPPETLLNLYDVRLLLDDPVFVHENAVLTAEGALCAAMRDTPFALVDAHVMVVGYGRIGRALTERLVGLNADVTVAARREGGRLQAMARGARAA